MAEIISEDVSETPHDNSGSKAREREQIINIIHHTFKCNQSNLGNAVKGCMSDFTRKLFEKNLITRAAKDSGDYDVVIKEVDSIWDLLPDVESLQVKFKEFRLVLMGLGGPPEMAGKTLHDLVQQEVDQVLPDVHFLRSKYACSASTPEIFVRNKLKINRMQDARLLRTESTCIEEMNDSSFMTKTDTDSLIYFSPEEVQNNNGCKDSAAPQFTLPLCPQTPTMSINNHQNIVLPNTGKLPSNTIPLNTPSGHNLHSTDSGVLMSKMNSPQDVNEPSNPELGKLVVSMSDSFLGSGMMPIQPVSNQQHSEPTESVLNTTIPVAYHPASHSSQQLSSVSERNMLSDMFACTRVELSYERRK